MSSAVGVISRLIRVDEKSLNYALHYKGTKVAAVAFVFLALVMGAEGSSIPLIYGPMMDELGWTRTEIMSVYFYRSIISIALALFFIGPIIERFGLRLMVLVCAFLVGTGTIWFLWVDSFIEYFLASFCVGTGAGTSFICMKILVSRWFNRNQGIAIGIAMGGTSFGGLVAPLVVANLIEDIGWRPAFASLSIGVWLVAIPLYVWLVKENPSEEDTLPETSSVSGKPNPQFLSLLKTADRGYGKTEMLKMPLFWMIIIGIFMVSMVDQGMLQHTVLYLERDVGLSTTLAAIGISGTFGIGVIAKIVAGKCYDKFSIKGITFFYILMAVGVLLAFPIVGLYSLLLFTGVRGLSHGGIVVDSPIFARHCFGPRALAFLLPVFSGTYMLGGSIGPVVLSLFYDNFGSYTFGFALFIALCLVPAVMLRWVAPLYRNEINKITEDFYQDPALQDAAIRPRTSSMPAQ